MFTRRLILAAAAALTFATPAVAADDWKAKYPELTFAIIPAENASGVIERYTPFMDYLSKEIGVKVTLRVANDYAAVIEGQRAGNIHIASYGPASFARALVTGVKTEAFGIEVNSDGAKGYYSVFYVRANSPYQKIEDLKGKNVGLVDPNSTSGYNMPLYALDKQGIKPSEFFGNMVITGSHENAVLALAQGTVDAAANFWNTDTDSNLTRMLNKHMVKDASGKELTKDDFRIIVKSPLIINSPVAFLADMPAELKDKIRSAFFNAAKNDKAAFDRLSDGKNQPWQPIDNEAYADTIKLIQFVDSLRKKG